MKKSEIIENAIDKVLTKLIDNKLKITCLAKINYINEIIIESSFYAIELDKHSIHLSKSRLLNPIIANRNILINRAYEKFVSAKLYL